MYSIFTALSSFFIIPAVYAQALQGTGIYENCSIDDPKQKDLECIVNHTIEMAAYIAGVILVVVIVVAGIMYITSMGNPERVGQAKKTLVGAIIGLIIVVLSATMVNIVINLINS